MKLDRAWCDHENCGIRFVQGIANDFVRHHLLSESENIIEVVNIFFSFFFFFPPAWTYDVLPKRW